MDSLSTVLPAGIILLLLGLGLGMFLGRRMTPGGTKAVELQQQLEDALQSRKDYEEEVVEHFSDTAKLLGSLTDSYRDVHNHLASGASKLCPGAGPGELEKLESSIAEAEIPPHLTDVQQPLDYAPKTSPDEKGMLNETFGLDRSEEEEDPLAEPTRH